MSLHKSKGLTSRVVVVCGCVEGLIPTLDADLTGAQRDAATREQRRLFYVAITRCRDILVISSFLQAPAALAYQMGARLQYGRTITSRFVDELGPTRPPFVSGGTWKSSGFGS